MHGLIFETSVCYWQNQPGYLSRDTSTVKCWEWFCTLVDLKVGKHAGFNSLYQSSIIIGQKWAHEDFEITQCTLFCLVSIQPKEQLCFMAFRIPKNSIARTITLKLTRHVLCQSLLSRFLIWTWQLFPLRTGPSFANIEMLAEIERSPHMALRVLYRPSCYWR